jgi:hypothetical protein
MPPSDEKTGERSNDDGESAMKKAMFGGSILGAAMALTGCMGGTSAATADLAWVPAGIDGRSDMFLDHNRLVTAAQLGDSTTAIPVQVDVTEWTLTATRLGTEEIVGTWNALDVVSADDIAMATPVDGELNPGNTDPITLPRGGLPSFGHGSGSGTIPGAFNPDEHPGLVIDWDERTGGIPDSVDAELWNDLNNAHPGCA